MILEESRFDSEWGKDILLPLYLIRSKAIPRSPGIREDTNIEFRPCEGCVSMF